MSARKPTAKQLAWAKTLRQKRIALLQLCVCAWPACEADNETGHHPECPAHAHIMENT